MSSDSLSTVALPIDAYLTTIRDSLAARPNLVVTAATGAGKTTRVPPAFLDDPRLAGKKILVLQPRRLAAKSTAARMAYEDGTPLGDRIGFQVRFESQISAKTRLIVITEGILERFLLQDPALQDVGLVIFDEFHERSLHSDLCLALLKELQDTLRPDLRLLVMSATLEEARIRSFLDACPLIDVPGRLFPVDIEYQGSGLRSSSSGRDIARVVVDALKTEFSKRRRSGDTLVFLPGVGEIQQCLDLSAPLCRQFQLDALALHGSLPLAEQERVLKNSPRPRLIFSTNIAETSLTLPNVTSVVDSGLLRLSVNDPAFGNEKIELRRISKQNATQRAGRAGRVQAGHCLRLWTRDEQLHLDESIEPEIHRLDLASSLLFLADWGVRDFQAFSWFEAPLPQPLRIAVEQLKAFGALSEKDSSITEFGKSLLAWPLSPRLAVFLQHCAQSRPGPELLEQAAFIAAALSERPFLGRDFDRAQAVHRLGLDPQESDLRFLAQLEGALSTRESGASSLPLGFQMGAYQSTKRVAAQILDVARQRVRAAGDRGNASAVATGIPTDTLSEALTRAFVDRVASRRSRESTVSPHSREARMKGGRGLTLGAQSLCSNSELFLAIDPFEVREGNRSFARVEQAHPISLEILQKIGGSKVARRRRLLWNSKENRAQAFEFLSFDDLPLSEEIPVPPTLEEIQRLQAENLFLPFDRFLDRNPRFQTLVRRVRLLLAHCESFQPACADWSDESLARELPKIHDPQACNLASQEENWLPSLEQLLVGSSSIAFLKQHAPHQVEVPSGSVLPLEYGDDPKNPPLLRARLQEIFGWDQSPQVAQGRMNVKLELLSPSYKPVQTTQDLASFWKNLYFEVRKELKARYPRHSWPDDPLQAVAVAKGGKKRGSEY